MMKHFLRFVILFMLLSSLDVSAMAGEKMSSSRKTFNTAAPTSVQSADSSLIGTALRFNGTTTYVDVSNSITLNSSAVAGELWMRADYLKSDWQVITANWGSTLTGQFHLSINPGNFLDLYMTTDGDASCEITDPTTFPTGIWQHVAFSMANGIIKLFRNGALVASGTYSGNLKTSFPRTAIGAKPNDDSLAEYPFKGDIDEVILWVTGRDSNQIAVDMDTVYSSVQSGMVGYWHFNEGAGLVAYNAVNDTGCALKGFTFDTTSDGWVPSTIPVTHSPLPIQLSLFTAEILDGKNVRLEWTTVSEVNNYGFYVQRSQDSLNNFNVLSNSFIKGHGTTLQARQYSYTDATAGQGKWWYRLQQVDLDGAVHNTEAVKVEVATGASDGALPTVFSLAQNYPNPFNPTTTITLALPRDARVSLEVYNTLGQKVSQLVDELMTAGYHSVVFDASQLASGLYLYRMKAGDYVATKKLLFLK